VRERVGALAERARQAQEARQQVHSSIPEMKAKFREKLATDPDGAVAELFDALADQRLQQADDEVTAARIDEAIVFADAHIPNFSEQWPGMHGLAREVGYSDEELNAIDDPRPLIILSLANHTARLMKAGIMDRMGNIVNAPQVEAQPLDPRLAAPDPQRTLSGGARSARSNASMADQLNEILAMTPEQFDKFDRENPGAIESLLKAA
jgi:cell division septation protein DedD